MPFNNDPYNQQLCKTLVESSFLEEFRTHMLKLYFDEFLVCSDSDVQHLRRKAEVLSDILTVIENEATNARATG